MKKIDQHIEIAYSSLSSLSSMGKKSAVMIQTSLEKHYTQVGITVINTADDLDSLVAKQPDLVFLGLKMVPLKGTPQIGLASKIWLPAYLDEQSINYTGRNALAIALDFNKPMAKQIVKGAGLATADYFVARRGQYQSTEELPLPFPLFIKPPNTGGGKGIDADSVVRDFAAYEAKVRSILADFGTASLVETYLPGREFSVAILESTHTKDLMALPIEFFTEQNEQGDQILGLHIKKADTERTFAVQDEAVKQKVNKLALNVFKVLGARDYGRIDIRLDERGIPHFLEANLVPGLAFHDFTSYFNRACWLNEAMDYDQMILHIVELGLAHPVATRPLPLPRLIDEPTAATAVL